MQVEHVLVPSGCDHLPVQNFKVQIELFTEFITPLVNQASGNHDDCALTVGAQHHLLQIKPRHDGFACPWVVGEEITQPHLWQKVFVDCADLVGERIDAGTVDGYEWVVKCCVLYAQGLGCQTELVRVCLERRLLLKERH